jgi:hypothetical protein
MADQYPCNTQFIRSWIQQYNRRRLQTTELDIFQTEILPALGPGKYQIVVEANGASYNQFVPVTDPTVGNLATNNNDQGVVSKESAANGIAWGIGAVMFGAGLYAAFKAVNYYNKKKIIETKHSDSQPQRSEHDIAPLQDAKEPRRPDPDEVSVTFGPTQSRRNLQLHKKFPIVKLQRLSQTLNPLRSPQMTAPDHTRINFTPVQIKRNSPELKPTESPEKPSSIAYYNKLATVNPIRGKRIVSAQKVTVQKQTDE